MDEIAPYIVPGGASVLLSITVMLIIYGKLVPARTVLSLLEGKDKIIETMQKTIDAYEQNAEDSADLALTVKKVLDALPLTTEVEYPNPNSGQANARSK